MSADLIALFAAAIVLPIVIRAHHRSIDWSEHPGREPRLGAVILILLVCIGGVALSPIAEPVLVALGWR